MPSRIKPDTVRAFNKRLRSVLGFQEKIGLLQKALSGELENIDDKFLDRIAEQLTFLKSVPLLPGNRNGHPALVSKFHAAYNCYLSDRVVNVLLKSGIDIRWVVNLWTADFEVLTVPFKIYSAARIDYDRGVGAVEFLTLICKLAAISVVDGLQEIGPLRARLSLEPWKNFNSVREVNGYIPILPEDEVFNRLVSGDLLLTNLPMQYGGEDVLLPIVPKAPYQYSEFSLREWGLLASHY